MYIPYVHRILEGAGGSFPPSAIFYECTLLGIFPHCSPYTNRNHRWSLLHTYIHMHRSNSSVIIYRYSEIKYGKPPNSKLSRRKIVTSANSRLKRVEELRQLYRDSTAAQNGTTCSARTYIWLGLEIHSLEYSRTPPSIILYLDYSKTGACLRLPLIFDCLARKPITI